MKKFWSLALALLSFNTFAADLTTLGEAYLYVNGYFHAERRDGVSAGLPEVTIGYDHRLALGEGIYGGPRVGVFWEQVLTFTTTTNTKFLVGGHIYKLFPVGDGISLKAGAAADVLNGDSRDPLYLYVGAEAGFRFKFSEGVYGEIPVELGMFPFFNGIPGYKKFGFQLGFGI